MRRTVESEYPYQPSRSGYRSSLQKVRCSFLGQDHCTSSFRRCVVRLCFIGLLVAILVSYKVSQDLDKWSVHAGANTWRGPCTEKAFDVAPSTSCDTFHDLYLLQRCGVFTSGVSRTQNKNITTAGFSIGSPPLFVRTKCGLVSPVALTKVTQREGRRPSPGSKVPNVVHYVSLASWEFTFLNYLSLLSVHKFLKPEQVLVHGDQLPHGYWWRRALQDVSNVYHVYRERTVRIQGWKVPWVEHSSDILRLQTLLDNGGIYLDTDVLVLRSFEPLRQYEMTLGRESSYGLGNSIILTSAGSPFVCMWMSAFGQYAPYPWNWAAYSVWAPNKLAQLLPEHVHIEQQSLLKPSWTEPALLYEGLYDWSSNYAVHVWKRYAPSPLPTGPEDLKYLNNTLGEIMRFIYFGSKDLFPPTSSSGSYNYPQCVIYFVSSVAIQCFLVWNLALPLADD